MSKTIQQCDASNYVGEIVNEILDAFFDIPFENSAYQTEAFVIAAEITPERAYRAVGLRMMSKINALKETDFTIKRVQIDIDEIEFKLQNVELDQFERRRLILKKEEAQSSVRWTQKLANDAVSELNVLYRHFKALPKYTREQFESAEKVHFEQRLMRQVVGLDGAKVALINMNEDAKAIRQYQEQISKLEKSEISNETLLRLVSEMPNFIKDQAEANL